MATNSFQQLLAQDRQARRLAVAPSCSCIVQAPAGSGKTTLLIERILRLLAVCERPDQILVVTFTKKATAQMQERLAQLLHSPLPLAAPADHDADQARYVELTRLLQRIRQRDQQQGWRLLENPAQLRIQTIDGLCSYLVQNNLPQQAPTRIVQGAEADYYYQLAVWQWLSDCCQIINTDTKISTSENKQANPAELLLQQLGFDSQRLVTFLAQLLARRDCWLPTLLALDEQALRQQMQQQLELVNHQLLQACVFPSELFTGWQQLYRETIAFYSADELTPATWQLIQELIAAPSWNALTVTSAKQLAGWLLTSQGKWRERWGAGQAILQPKCISISKSNSDIAKTWKALKARWRCWIQQLAASDSSVDPSQEPDTASLRGQLITLLQAPPLIYSKQQWQLVSALLQILPPLLAYLQLIWQERQIADYTEMVILAERALNPDFTPREQNQTAQQERHTHRALAQLFKWRHLLVDEFQDTSLLHFQFLSQLTAQWTVDQCSIFLVGDPMQSIYRFRQAEVGLFLLAQQQGLGNNNIKLTNLTLHGNFRSSNGLVQWYNRHFSQIFPPRADISLGAVSYSPSIAGLSTPQPSDLTAETVTLTMINSNQLTAAPIRPQTPAIVTMVKNIQQRYPGEAIAILAQTRGQLYLTAQALQQAQLAYQAIELNELLSDPVARQLWALMRLVLAPQQRWSWYHWWLVRYNTAPTMALEQEWRQALHARPLVRDAKALNTTPLPDDPTDQQFNYLVFMLQLSSSAISWLTGLEPLLQTSNIINSSYQPVSQKQLWIRLIKSCHIWDRPCVAETATQQLALLELFDPLWELAPQLDVALLELKLAEMYAPTSQMTTCPSPISAEADTTTHHPITLMTIHKAKGLEFPHVIIAELNSATRRNSESPILIWQEVLQPVPDKQSTPGATRYSAGILLASRLASTDQPQNLSAPTSAPADALYNYLLRQARCKNHYELMRLFYVAATRAQKSLHLIVHAADKPVPDSLWQLYR